MEDMSQLDFAKECAKIVSEKLGGVPEDYLSNDTVDDMIILGRVGVGVYPGE